MDNSSFFVDLPSDASMAVHPSNQGGSYTVDLPETISLSAHQWEVGLAEAIFQQDWQPALKEDVWVAFCKNDLTGGKFSRCGAAALTEEQLGKIAEATDFSTLFSTAIKPLILNAIKDAGLEKENFSSALATRDEKTGRVKLTVKVFNPDNTPVRMELSQSLLQILGFTRSQLPVEGRYFITDLKRTIETPMSHFKPSLARAMTSLWVYTNIVRPHITGHSYSPLLRVIGIDHAAAAAAGQEDSLITLSLETRVVQYDKIHYYPLLSDEISSISILITNGGGRAPIKFSTPVFIKLHFRRRTNSI